MADDVEVNSGEQGSEAVASTATRSGLARPWLIRIVPMLIVAIGTAVFFYYDAVIGYPVRGEKYAEYARYQYLLKSSEARQQEDRTAMNRDRLRIENPKTALSELKESAQRERDSADAANESSSRHYRAQAALQKRTYLVALQTIGRLNEEPIEFPDPESAHASPAEELEAATIRWNTEKPPAPLAFYDIPSQWIVGVLATVATGYLAFLMVRTVGRTYTWDPESKRLTLPTGESMVPADLESVDKRKWDKFIVFLGIKASHEKFGGQELRFDLFRHSHLEDWILEMEAEAFPDQESDETDDEEGTASADAGEPADATA